MLFPDMGVSGLNIGIRTPVLYIPYQIPEMRVNKGFYIMFGCMIRVMHQTQHPVHDLTQTDNFVCIDRRTQRIQRSICHLDILLCAVYDHPAKGLPQHQSHFYFSLF